MASSRVVSTSVNARHKELAGTYSRTCLLLHQPSSKELEAGYGATCPEKCCKLLTSVPTTVAHGGRSHAASVQKHSSWLNSAKDATATRGESSAKL